MNRQKTTDYAVAFTALTDGDDLGCSKDIEVSWTKPTAGDQATLTLDCNCTKHPSDPDMTFDTPTTAASGTHTFTLGHPNRANETNRAVVVTITHNGAFQNNDTRIKLNAQCPVIPHVRKGPKADGKAARAAHDPGDAIQLDAEEPVPVRLVRGENKRLRGTFLPGFGQRIMVFVQQVMGGGRQVLLLAKEAHTKVIRRRRVVIRRWRVTLPRSLWESDVILNIRLVFVRPDGILHNGYTFPTRIVRG